MKIKIALCIIIMTFLSLQLHAQKKDAIDLDKNDDPVVDVDRNESDDVPPDKEMPVNDNDIDKDKDVKKKNGDKDTKKKVKNDSDIVITATRDKRAIGEVPASVKVVTRDDIAKSSIQFLDETLNTVSGVYNKRSKIADTTTSVSLRGFAGDNRSLTLLDGSPLNDSYSGGVNWFSVPPDSIERIEVAKGPFSSLYGRNAMGGVINIISKKPEGREIVAKTRYGSYNTIAPYVFYGDRLGDKVSFFVSGNYLKSDGYRSYPYQTTFSVGTGTGTSPFAPTGNFGSSTDVRGFAFDSSGRPYVTIGDKGMNWLNAYGCSARLFIDITKNHMITLLANFSENLTGYRGGRSYMVGSNGVPVYSGKVVMNLLGQDYNKTITPDMFTSGDNQTRNQTYMLKYNGKIDRVGLNARVSWREDSTWYTTPSSGSFEAGGPGTVNITKPKRTVDADVNAVISIIEKGDYDYINKLNLIVGAGLTWDQARGSEWKVVNYRETSDWTKHGNRYFKLSNMSGEQRMESLYAQLETRLVDMVSVYCGARFDYWTNYDGNSGYQQNAASNPFFFKSKKTNDWSVMPRIGLVVNPPLDLGEGMWKVEAIKFSYGQSFSPPTLYKMYKYWAYFSTTYLPNPWLKSEKGESWEVTLEQSFFKKHLKLTATYFQSVIRNMFYLYNIDPTTRIYSNVGEGTVIGCEGEAAVSIIKELSLFGSVTYMKTQITKNLSDPYSYHQHFQNVPRLMYATGVTWQHKYIEGSFTWHFTDKVYANSDNSDHARNVLGVYDRIKLMDAKLSVMPVDYVKLSFGCNNILDYQYYQYYKSQGRTFYGEAQFKYE